MQRRSLLGLSLAGAIALGLAGVGVRAQSGIAPTLVTAVPNFPAGPIGVDWLPAGPYADQLLVSSNYDSGVPANFDHVDRNAGGYAHWGAQSGWNNEIYFASVRPGQQAGGWFVGDVFSAKGNATAADASTIAQFHADGTPVNLNFATLPGETKQKRGGVTFDRVGVAGYDLIVIAANDVVGPSAVYRINSAGIATHLATIPVHVEGVTTIPNDPTAYGPWAGKILTGAEFENQFWTIDPTSGATASFGGGTLGLPSPGEDMWVIPANSTFYGVEFGDVYANTRLWKIDVPQWTGMVGQLLLAREYNAELYSIKWDSATLQFVTSTVYAGNTDPTLGPTHWEHITFVPEPASLGDFVWLDKNGNGQQDAGEPGVAGATVNLYACDGTFVKSTTTGSGGAYAFARIDAGCYYVVFVPPSGYVFTGANSGSDATDSDAGAGGQTGQYNLSGGQTDNTVDAGLLPIDLSVTKDVDNDTPTLLTNVVFTVTVSNAAGLSTATGVTVADALPAGLSYVSSSASQGSYSNLTNIWTVGTLASPSTATLSITAKVIAGGTQTNLAQVQVANQIDRDSTPGNAPGVSEDDDASVDVTPVAVISTHTVTLRKVVVPPSDPGRFDLTIGSTTVANVGNGGQVQVSGLGGGILVTLGEAANAASATSLSDYTSSLSCGFGLLSGGATSGTFSMRDTDVTCVLTNTRKGTGGFTTYTQGGWGAVPNGNNPGALLSKNFAAVYPTGVTIGRTTSGAKYLKFTTAKSIEVFLPAGGKAAVLTASATNPASSTAGVFAGQLLALQLGVDFSKAGMTKTGLAGLKVASGKLAGKTVQQVLDLANDVISGNTAALTPYNMTISQLNDVLDAINNNFDGGTANGGYLI